MLDREVFISIRKPYLSLFENDYSIMEVIVFLLQLQTVVKTAVFNSL